MLEEDSIREIRLIRPSQVSNVIHDIRWDDSGSDSGSFESASVASIRNLSYFERFYLKYQNIIRIILSGFIGIGTALALTPINDKELNDSNIDSDVLHIANIVNCFLVGSGFFSYLVYRTIKKTHPPIEVSISKKLGFISSSFLNKAVPLYLLWAVELSNQSVEKESGFSKFIAWASFTTPSLVLYVISQVYSDYKQHFSGEKVELTSCGAQIAVYGLSFLSSVGKISTGTVIIDKICFDNKEGFKPLSIVLSVLFNSYSAYGDFYNLKKTFRHNPDYVEKSYNLKELGLILFALLENGLYTIPEVLIAYQLLASLPNQIKVTALAVNYIVSLNSKLANSSFIWEKESEINILGSDVNTIPDHYAAIE